MKLRTIQELNLSPPECELLRLAGYENIEDIEQFELNPFIDKVLLTNKIHRVFPTEIPSSTIQAWWHLACNIPMVTHDSAHSALVNFENDLEIVEMIKNSPFAEPLAARSLAEKNVPVSAIPEAILLTAARGDISVRVTAKSQKHTQATPLTTAVTSNVNSIALTKKKAKIDLSRVRSLEAPAPIEPLVQAPLNLISATREETNQGVSPNSRRYIRGVLHPQPAFFLWGAFFAITTPIAIPLGLAGIVLLLLRDQKPESYLWVPSWIIAFPISVFVLGFLYLCISHNCSCRVCGQKLFVPKNCLKNSKAHRIPFLGSILPIAIHALLFRWFRCTFCGTAIRLKE